MVVVCTLYSAFYNVSNALLLPQRMKQWQLCFVSLALLLYDGCMPTRFCNSTSLHSVDQVRAFAASSLSCIFSLPVPQKFDSRTHASLLKDSGVITKATRPVWNLLSALYNVNISKYSTRSESPSNSQHDFFSVWPKLGHVTQATPT